VWIYPAAVLPRLLSGSVRHREPAQPEAELFIMSWCGMRGIVSLAAALALPVALPGGVAFPYRDLIVFLTFVVIAATLVVQGLTLSPLIRRLKVGRDRSLFEEHQNATQALGKAAIAAIERHAAEENAPEDLTARIRTEFSEKFADPTVHGADEDLHVGRARRLRRAALQAERQELIRLWLDNQISDDVLHHIEEDLDYQESHL
jgi:CPA1 family monovalent cation:H+ antiporter